MAARESVLTAQVVQLDFTETVRLAVQENVCHVKTLMSLSTNVSLKTYLEVETSSVHRVRYAGAGIKMAVAMKRLDVPQRRILFARIVHHAHLVFGSGVMSFSMENVQQWCMGYPVLRQQPLDFSKLCNFTTKNI